MGVSKKPQAVDGGLVRASLKPISTKPGGKARQDDEEDACSTTPTAKEARIPEKLSCPPAPRKRRPSSRCHFDSVRVFFTPPDLETVFKLHVEKAN
ncbi:cyclin-dependent protein kinase inhibitor SMR6-like [Juglans microcarpa x Juglans regia]|uniref:cyclin-dependent protein kinase inhibitor SMR6-like n=1 Tax=Juglans microcarpa x Juglans regia TaxID=2249226 RepID=UPI001B7E1C24|nr:cyclin-dependent protein kinase inhibitor SMR6-like [Juglans microcarpa x Juglans regia]